MSLDKAIKYGKERRKPYRKSKAISKLCRNHGSCSWCRKNRLYQKEIERMCCEVDDLTDPFEREYFEHYPPFDDNHILIAELDIGTPYEEAPFRNTEDD